MGRSPGGFRLEEAHRNSFSHRANRAAEVPQKGDGVAVPSIEGARLGRQLKFPRWSDARSLGRGVTVVGRPLTMGAVRGRWAIRDGAKSARERARPGDDGVRHRPAVFLLLVLGIAQLGEPMTTTEAPLGHLAAASRSIASSLVERNSLVTTRSRARSREPRPGADRSPTITSTGQRIGSSSRRDPYSVSLIGLVSRTVTSLMRDAGRRRDWRLTASGARSSA